MAPSGSLTALPPIVPEIDGQVRIIFDSGIRGGTDAMKVLALGADLVALGVRTCGVSRVAAKR